METARSGNPIGPGSTNPAWQAHLAPGFKVFVAKFRQEFRIYKVIVHLNGPGILERIRPSAPTSPVEDQFEPTVICTEATRG